MPYIVSLLLSGGLAFPIFAIACASDLLDGALARRLGTETRLGATFDAFTDFLLVFGVSATLFLQGLLPLWFLALVLFAFAQFAAAKPRPKRDPLGRHIGTVLFIALGATLLTPIPWIALWSSTMASLYIVASLSARWLFS